jgi:hypothetical protein
MGFGELPVMPRDALSLIVVGLLILVVTVAVTMAFRF